VSTHTLLTPNLVDQTNANVTPAQNYSPHVRMLPYLEQQASYNAWNHCFGARWNIGSPIQYEMPNGTVIITVMNHLLCPSDSTNPGSTIPNQFGGTHFAGASNYPANIGLNRRINGGNGTPGNGNWQMNGPSYFLSDWDNNPGSRLVSINTFTDGTSNTVIYSEWVKGNGLSPGKNGLGEVYQSGATVGQFATDFQWASLCGDQSGLQQSELELEG